LPAQLRLSDPERGTLAEIGKRVGRKALEKVACVVKPDTILAYRRLIARKFDGSQCRIHPGRPRVSAEVEKLVVRFARENSGWGYDRIVGAPGQPGSSDLGPDCGQYPVPQQSRTRSQAEANDDLEGIHPADGRARRNRFLHC
jgi:hypothetical protein